MADELREIISDWAWKIHYKQCDSLYIENEGIFRATSKIKSLFKSKLPKRKLPLKGTTEYYASTTYNELLTEIKKRWEEI